MSKDHAGARGRSYKLNKYMYWSTELSPVSRSDYCAPKSNSDSVTVVTA